MDTTNDINKIREENRTREDLNKNITHHINCLLKYLEDAELIFKTDLGKMAAKDTTNLLSSFRNDIVQGVERLDIYKSNRSLISKLSQNQNNDYNY
ncbi:MAG: hypothetical protein E7351_01715 [Clostridiales bacterium]|nr:hypothetical protein [Clostridiales bacterium]